MCFQGILKAAFVNYTCFCVCMSPCLNIYMGVCIGGGGGGGMEGGTDVHSFHCSPRSLCCLDVWSFSVAELYSITSI